MPESNIGLLLRCREDIHRAELTEAQFVEILHNQLSIASRAIDVIKCAVGIISDENGKVLLLKRGEKAPSYPSKLCFPGGEWQPGDESLEMTAVREIFEETGLNVEIEREVGVRRTVDLIRERIMIVHIFKIRPKKTYQINLSDEHSDSGFYDMAEIDPQLLAGRITNEFLLWQKTEKAKRTQLQQVGHQSDRTEASR